MGRGGGGRQATKGWRRLKSTPAHTEAMLRNMVTSLFEHQRIETTVPKAKEAQRMAERMITLAKKGTLVHRRKALAYIRTEAVVNTLFSEYAARYATRPGGYTRVVRTRMRYGDNAPMAYLELVDRPGELQTKKSRYVISAPRLYSTYIRLPCINTAQAIEHSSCVGGLRSALLAPR
jgi:large subunit ribosomal protein L17